MPFVLVDAFGEAFVVVGELGVINAHQIEDGGVDGMHMQTVFNGIQAEVVGGTVGLAAFHAAAGHPHGEAGGVVVPPVALLGHGCAAKFTAPDDERLVEQAAGLQIGEQAGDGFIDGVAVFAVIHLDAFVRVPLAARTAVELDEAHAVLDEATRQEAVAAKNGGRLVVHAVELLGGVGLLAEIDRIGSLRLHLKGEFVAFDAGVEFGVAGTRGIVVAIQSTEQVQLLTLTATIDAFRVVEELDWRAFGAELHALIHRRHEAIAPVAGTVHHRGLAVFDDDKAGQVLIRGAEAILRPGTERGTTAEDRAGVH